MNKVRQGHKLLSKKARQSKWILLLGLLGCQPAGQTIPPSPSPTATASPSAIPSPQPSPSASASSMPNPSSTPTPEATPTPSPSISPSATPTPEATPVPTPTPSASLAPLSFQMFKIIAGKDPNSGRLESGLRAEELAMPQNISGLAVDASSNIWFMNSSNQILSYITAQIIRQATINNPEIKYRLYWEKVKNIQDRGPIVFDPQSKEFYMVQTNLHQIVRINPETGNITPIAGTGRQGFNGDGQALSCMLSQPSDIARDAEGNLYITDTGNHLIRKITTDGRLITIAGQYVQDTKVVDTDNDGRLDDEVPTLQPIGDTTGDGGPSRNARVNNPTAITVDSQGTVYFSSYSNTIRRISGDIITRFAGSGTKGFNGSGFRADLVHFTSVNDLSVGPDGLLYFSDDLRVRRTNNKAGDLIVEDVLGNGREVEIGDDILDPLKAELRPGPIDFDAQGNLYVYDIAHRRLRMLERKNVE